MNPFGVVTGLLSVLLSGLLSGDEPLAPALKGLDPVALGRGEETAGVSTLDGTDGRYRYLFANEANREVFAKDPARYGIQWGGGCGAMGPLSGAGNPARFAVHDGRVFIFASDGCRAGFLRDPKAFEWSDSPAPEADAAARTAGAALFDALVKSLGGGPRIETITGIRMRLEFRQKSGRKDDDSESRFMTGFALMRDGRMRLEEAWGESVWAFVATPDDAFATATDRVPVTLVASQRRELEQTIDHNLVPIVFAREREDFVALDRGTEGEGDSAVRLLEVHFDGQSTTLGLDPETSRPRFLRFRGRADPGPCGVIEDHLSDWRKASGLAVPHGITRTFDGKPVERGRLVEATFEVGDAIDAAIFSRGGDAKK